MKQNKTLKKFTRWEYWPSYMYYIPNLPYLVYLCLKARSFSFYTAVNPGIKSSGNGTESKFKTLNIIPTNLRPNSIFIKKNSNNVNTLSKLKSSKITYPLIAKPDVGFRGNFVKKIKDEKHLVEYLNQHPFDTILQDFINLPKECGVFYHRMPNEDKGHITSLTLKHFMEVIGDGKHKIHELVHQNKRARHYTERLKQINIDIWELIPKNGERLILSEIGNHARGTEFINGNDLIDSDLENVFNDLSSKIPGFYYGRFDIKYNTLEELKQAKNFMFIEVNGIISEPTHIYDASKGSYLGALKTIRTFWKKAYEIAMINHQNGIEYMKTQTFLKEIKLLLKHYKHIKKIAKSRV